MHDQSAVATLVASVTGGATTGATTGGVVVVGGVKTGTVSFGTDTIAGFACGAIAGGEVVVVVTIGIVNGMANPANAETGSFACATSARPLAVP